MTQEIDTKSIITFQLFLGTQEQFFLIVQPVQQSKSHKMPCANQNETFACATKIRIIEFLSQGINTQSVITFQFFLDT